MVQKKQGRDLRSRWGWIAAAAAIALGALILCPLRAAEKAKPDDLQKAISRAVSDLADDHPDVRELARQKLLALRRRDLAALRAVVQQRLPLTPAEADPLREIVTHVYLSDESYKSDATKGFVGVIFDAEHNEIEPETGGVEILHRMPGFCASRFLQDGDVVLGIGSNPAAMIEVRNYKNMTDEIQRHSAGQTVLFRLLRRG